MEKFVAGFAVLGALLAANVSLSEAQTETSYFKAGGELRLSPVPVSEEITSIVWKYDKNLLAEWVKGPVPLTYYSRFKVRSELNTTTGVLVIQRMTAEDTALYSVEINNKVQSLVYQAVEIQEVPQPTVDLQPLACNRTQTCGLKCYGETAKAEPVSYFWRNDDGDWESSGDRKKLSREEMDDVKTFYCRMKNPVSQKDSEPFKNPFYQESKPAESSPAGAIAGGIVGFLVLVAVGFCVWKRKPIMKKISSFRDNPAASNPESPAGDKTKNQLLDKTGTGGKDENELDNVESGSNHREN